MNFQQRRGAVCAGAFWMATACLSLPAAAQRASVPIQIQLSPPNATINVGQTQAFSFSQAFFRGLGQQGGAHGAPTAWATSNTNIATIDTNGVVTAVSPGTVAVTAVSGPFRGSAQLIVNAVALNGTVVINEVDYDDVGADLAEFIELYNNSASPIALTGYKIYFVNGFDNSVYSTIDLSPAGSIAAGQYLVAGATFVVAGTPSGTLTIDLGNLGNLIQNGVPDGIALVDNNNNLKDALSYEGSMTAAVLPGFPGPVSLVEGTALAASVADSNTVNGSLCRIPNGSDTNDANTDWEFCPASTPGFANTVVPNGVLVINEVDYDNIGSDTAEFIELYNPSASAVALGGYKLYLVNGVDTSVYSTIDLSPAGSVAPGQYLVAGASSVVAGMPNGTLTIDLGSGGNLIQNGSPDGIALAGNNNLLIDALSYEGSITGAIIPGFPGPVNLVEGNALIFIVADSNTVDGSLCRIPNGSDTDDANTDWKFCSVSTPGVANTP